MLSSTLSSLSPTLSRSRPLDDESRNYILQGVGTGSFDAQAYQLQLLNYHLYLQQQQEQQQLQANQLQQQQEQLVLLQQQALLQQQLQQQQLQQQQQQLQQQLQQQQQQQLQQQQSSPPLQQQHSPPCAWSNVAKPVWDEPTRFLESLHQQLVFDINYRPSSITDSWLSIARSQNPNINMNSLVVALLRTCMTYYTSGRVKPHEVPKSTFGMTLAIVRNHQMSELNQIIACRNFEEVSGYPVSILFNDISLWSKAVHPFDRENAEAIIFQNTFKLVHFLQQPQTFCDAAIFRWLKPDGCVVHARISFVCPDELNLRISDDLHIYGACGFTTFFDSPPLPE